MRACPRCGEENPERARFCWSCGTPLGEEARAEEEERKVVSALFVDLVGFTARSDRTDPEDVRATLRPYHARVSREIERFGGTVEKFVGDAVMAVFGAPVAHEDDAERAVRAALRILDAIGELNEAEGLELAVRAAVATGEAVVSLGARSGEGEGIATGDVVNTASRLQGAAPVGALVVAEATHRATRHAIDYEELEPVAVKGKAAPVPLWRALGARSRFGVDAEAAPATPFVGREHELRLLQETFARALTESEVQLVTVTGEPGVGKTRLVAEFRSWVDDRPELVFWRQGRCLPYGEGITFWALGEIVKAHTGILESDGPAEAATKLDAAVGAVAEDAERDWLRARLAPLVGLPAAGEAGRDESFAAWRQFLEGVAAQRPLVLLFEDLHWADPALLELVEHLVDWSSGVPLLVLCTGRPELYEGRPGWGGGKRNSATVSLSPLSGDETARLLAALLERTVLPAETQTALLERCGGNPLYAEEFVRMLLDEGILERRGAAIELAAGAEIPVPVTVQALIAARLDTLQADRKALVHDASVIGKVFWAGALEAMGGRSPEEVRAGLHQLARQELVRPARASSVEGQAEYAFWHGLIRDIAYGQIPRAGRAAKHRAAAEWIERLAGDRMADHAEVLAHHYGQALEIARATGSEDAGLREKALASLLAAGERALRLDVMSAVDSYGRALEVMPPDDPARSRVLSTQAWALYLAGRLDESLETSEQARALARPSGDRVGEALAMLELSRIHWTRGDRARYRELFDGGFELLEQAPAGPELVQACASRAGAHMHYERAEDCIAWAERALALAAEVGGPQAQVVRARQFRGFGLCQLGRVEEGIVDLQEALQLALELGLGAECVTAHVNLGDIRSWTEGPARGLAVYLAAAELARRRGLKEHEEWARTESLWELYALGRWDELIRQADELIASSEARGGGHVDRSLVPYRAFLLARRGEIAQAGDLVPVFLPRARTIEDPQILVPALAFAASIELARGDPASARLLVEEHLATTEGRPVSRLAVAPVVARCCLRLGAIDLLDRLLAGPGVPMARLEHGVVTSRAVAAEARGTIDEAAALYGEAASRWAEHGHVPERGEALLGEGRCLLQQSRDKAAIARLREARTIFEGLGALPAVAEIDGLLGQPASARAAK